MAENLNKDAGQYPPCPTYKRQKAPEEWMDKDMKEFYMVRMEGD